MVHSMNPDTAWRMIGTWGGVEFKLMGHSRGTSAGRAPKPTKAGAHSLRYESIRRITGRETLLIAHFTRSFRICLSEEQDGGEKGGGERVWVGGEGSRGGGGVMGPSGGFECWRGRRCCVRMCRYNIHMHVYWRDQKGTRALFKRTL